MYKTPASWKRDSHIKVNLHARTSEELDDYLPEIHSAL